jgi:hypothetical protein
LVWRYHSGMPKIELQRSLSVPSVPARSALSAILHAIEQQREEWSDFALYLNFGHLGLPDVGYVAIPVTISISSEELEPRHAIHFTIRARRSPDAFPTWNGAIGIDASGPSSAQIWLGGDYKVPMHALGGIFDKLVGGGSAPKTLENMLHELADATEARVQQRERANARYRLIFNTGD